MPTETIVTDHDALLILARLASGAPEPGDDATLLRYRAQYGDPAVAEPATRADEG